ncbi:MAG: hypothetical protein BWY69_00367 [Planctomycetes bacterium ADurb.Bin401]|nr:MAG: hypothetical protein BWY69_00367 [Planctomycetes bacterium ADurb.Bin401]
MFGQVENIAVIAISSIAAGRFAISNDTIGYNMAAVDKYARTPSRAAACPIITPIRICIPRLLAIKWRTAVIFRIRDCKAVECYCTSIIEIKNTFIEIVTIYNHCRRILWFTHDCDAFTYGKTGTRISSRCNFNCIAVVCDIYRVLNSSVWVSAGHVNNPV